MTNPTTFLTILNNVKLTALHRVSILRPLFPPSGQVAQLVERGPEKAGVGGSIPSLATNNFNNLQIAKNIQFFQVLADVLIKCRCDLGNFQDFRQNGSRLDSVRPVGPQSREAA